MEPSERTSLSGAQTQRCQATEMQLLRFFGALPQRAEPSQWCQLPWKDVSPAAAPQSVSQTLHLCIPVLPGDLPEELIPTILLQVFLKVWQGVGVTLAGSITAATCHCTLLVKINYFLKWVLQIVWDSKLSHLHMTQHEVASNLQRCKTRQCAKLFRSKCIKSHPSTRTMIWCDVFMITLEMWSTKRDFLPIFWQERLSTCLQPAHKMEIEGSSEDLGRNRQSKH